MKKFASLVGAGAILLTVAFPAFAHHRHYNSDDTSVRNYARISNEVDVEAETGDNEVEGFMVFGGRIRTGNATAYGDVFNDVNYTNLDCDGCDGDLSVRNYARVRNEVDVEANTGDNEIEGFSVFGGRIRTGGAYADSLVTNLVNTTISGGTLEE